MCNEISCYESNKPALTVDPESRRLFLKGVASLPLAYVLADVELAKAAAHGGDTVTIDTDRAGKVSGYLAEPDDKNAPTVILIHEWWGLNDHIKAVAQEFKAKGTGAPSRTDCNRAIAASASAFCWTIAPIMVTGAIAPARVKGDITTI